MNTRSRHIIQWHRAAICGLLFVSLSLAGLATAGAQDFAPRTNSEFAPPAQPVTQPNQFAQPPASGFQAGPGNGFQQATQPAAQPRAAQPQVTQPRVARRDVVTSAPQTGFEIPTTQTIVSEAVDASDSVQTSATSAVRNSGVVTSKRLLEVIRGGGPLMIPIGICSIILLVFLFERLVSLRKSRIIPHAFATRFVEQIKEKELNQDKAILLCDRNDSPLARVFKAGCMKWGRPSVEVEQAVLDEAERTSNGLRRFLRLINGIATVCPLLGLLGTVLGMIHAFDAIASVSGAAENQAGLIATGISQALLTTAAGLSVAIPAYIAYIFFSSRVDRHVMEIDAHGQKLVNQISSEAIAVASHTTTSSKRSRKAAA